MLKFIKSGVAFPFSRIVKYLTMVLPAERKLTVTMLKSYWFILNPQDRFGPKNIGVSAYSKEEAISLISEALNKLYLDELFKDINVMTEVIENVDIGLLDQNHVIPNMGVVTWKGVWWPNLNG